MTIMLTAVVYNNVWIHNNLQTANDFFDILCLSVAIVSWLWTLVLVGAHHSVEIVDDRVVLSRCWFWKSRKLPAVPKKQCQLVIAPCFYYGRFGRRWRGYWIELVLPKSRERLVLACSRSEETIRTASEELHRATGIRVFRRNAEREFQQCYPMIPFPRLTRLLMSQFVFG